MSLRDALERGMAVWQQARTEPFAQHPLAVFIRGEAADEVEGSLANKKGLTVRGSAGAGQWAAVPWVAVFDELVTDSATHGY
jgi:5-methylcytosine-specific restriction protein A